MPSAPNGKTILITGASGFVATWVVRSFLEAGYHVRGSVRSEETANNVRNSHPGYNDQLSFVIVKDIAQKGAFDEAVKGVDGVSLSCPSVSFGMYMWRSSLLTDLFRLFTPLHLSHLP